MKSIWKKWLIYTILILGLMFLVNEGVLRWFQIYDASTKVGVTQTVVDVLLVPLGVFGVLWTIEEFRNAQEMPIPKLTWDNGDTVINIPKPKKKKFITNGIYLRNKGNRIASKYQISLMLPAGFRPEGNDFWGVGNWKNKYFISIIGDFLFPKSFHQYPGFGLNASSWSDKLEISYEVFCDIGGKTEGTLTIQFE